MQTNSIASEQKLPSKSIFHLAKLPFYYGWVILLVSSIGMLASIPGQTMGVSVFIDHLIKDLQISRVSISSAYMLGTLTSSLIIPFAGMFLDKKGSRLTGTLAALALSLSLVFLAFSGQISRHLTDLFSLPPQIFSFVIVTFAFLGIRFFGQGVTEIVNRTMLAKWFSTRRGLAAGIMGIVTAFGFSLAPRPLQAMVVSLGWIPALFLLSLLLVCIYIPIVLIFFRSDPESVGMVVEQGLPLRKLPKKALLRDSSTDYTVAQVRKQMRFWVMALTLSFWSVFGTAFTFHIVSINAEIGIGANEAVKIFLPISFISVAAQFIGSYLSDRIAIKKLFLSFTLSVLLTSVSLAMLGTPVGRTSLILFYGMSNGLSSMLTVVTWPKLFGRKHLGAINGMATSIAVAGSALGPWLFSIVQSLTSTYRTMGGIGAIACLGLFILISLMNFSPPKAERHDSAGNVDRQSFVS